MQLLHRGLQEAGTQPSLLLRYPSQAGGGDSFRVKSDLRTRLGRLWRRRALWKKYTPFDAVMKTRLELLSPSESIFVHLHEQIPTNSVVNLHWVAGCIDVPTFFKSIRTALPVVWTLHDLWPMSGGCHYAAGCEAFTQNCGSCPYLETDDPDDLTHQEWEGKRSGYAALGDEDMIIVTPSQWLAREANRSSLLGRFETRVIPYGIDLDTFAPREQNYCRDTLGIPREAIVLAFVADGVMTRRKGFSVLAEALAAVTPEVKFHLISVGSGPPPPIFGHQVSHFGRVENNRLLSLLYSAADAFVLPSLEDNLPLTGLESLACGTPIIGSAVGGIPDIARPGQTGFLHPAADVSALAELLRNIAAHPEELAAMRASCRKVAEQEYGISLQADNYIALYSEVMARRAGTNFSAMQVGGRN